MPNIDLEYCDPLAPVIEAEVVIKRARKARARRRTLAGLASAVVVAAAAGAVTIPRLTSGGTDTVAGSASGFNPIPGVHVTQLQHWQNITAFAYYTDGMFCGGASAPSGPQSEPIVSYSCGLGIAGRPAPWVQKPFVLDVGIQAPEADGQVTVGLVRGPITTVSLTFAGKTYTAPVTQLNVPGANGIGAYTMVFPADEVSNEQRLDAMQQLTGYDAAGDVVVR